MPFLLNSTFWRRDYANAVFSLFLLLVALFPLETHAVESPDTLEVQCSSEDPHSAILGCTKLIERGLIDRYDIIDAFARRASAYLKVKDFRSAVRDYDVIIRAGPPNADVHALRGVAHFELDECGRAVEDFSKAIQLTTNPEPVHFQLRGICLVQIGEYEQALSDFQVVYAAEPERVPRFERGAALAATGRKREAVQDFTAVLRRNQNSKEALYNRALAYAELGRFSDCVSDIEEYLVLDTGFSMAYWLRGSCYGETGRYAAAISDLSHAIQLNPEFQPAYRALGAALLRNGDYHASTEAFSRAVEMNARDVSAINGLAWTLYASGKAGEGLPLARRAVELAPDSMEVRDTLAHILVQLGLTVEAFAEFEKAAELGGAARIREMQKALRQKNFYTGEINGSLDRMTRASLRACIDVGCQLLSD